MYENGTAKTRYSQLSIDRTTVLNTARECAKLTIPSLIPPEGANSNTILGTPYQSLGAYGVNNLAAKLLLSLYPPGTAFFRYVLPEDVSLQGTQEDREAIEKKLAAIENRAIQKFETSVVRPMKAEELTHLVVTGNVLTYFPDLEGFRMFRLDQYVVRRDSMGKLLEAFVHERVHPASLDELTRAACKVDPEQKEQVDVYTAIWVENGRCKWHQEINGTVVPDSEGESSVELSPWNALRWKAVPGSDYGRGHCEEYLGDLLSLEGLSKAMVEFAAVAAKILFLVHPGSTTDVKDVNRAESGDAVTGSKDDIDVFQLDKYADFQVVERTAARLEERLSRAFLLRSGLIRDAERVTAEEVRATAQELEDTLGGVYTVLTQEEQTPFVRRLLAVLTPKVIPRLPPGSVEPVVVTGFQALGRNHALNKLRGFVQDMVTMLTPEIAAKALNSSEVATRLALGWGLESAHTLIKSRQQIEAEDAAAAQNNLLNTAVEKGTAPLVAGAMKQQ